MEHRNPSNNKEGIVEIVIGVGGLLVGAATLGYTIYRDARKDHARKKRTPAAAKVTADSSSSDQTADQASLPT